MKKVIIYIILAIILLNPVNAKTIEEEMHRLDSFEIAGKNITLLSIGDKERSVVLCINNEIKIIDKGNRNEIGNIKIEPSRIYEDYAKLKITYSEEVACNESCSNSACFGTSQNIGKTEENISTEQQSQQQEIQQESLGINSLSIILFFVVLVLLLVLLFKKKR